MPTLRPTRIPGRWKEGYALDYHSVSSIYVGDDEYGHPKFETTRTELGELLFRLKYRSDTTVVGQIADAAVSLLNTWRPDVDLIVPVPASRERLQQPVILLTQAIADAAGIQVGMDIVDRVRDIPELKDSHDFGDRLQLLEGAHTVDATAVSDHRVLLIDDLYRSGATLNAIAETLYDQGGAEEVFALTITRTRGR